MFGLVFFRVFRSVFERYGGFLLRTLILWYYGECDDGHLQKGEYPTFFFGRSFVFLLQHQATIPKKPSDSNNQPGCSRKVLRQLGGGHFPNLDPFRRRGRPEHRGVSHDFLG